VPNTEQNTSQYFLKIF